jgi:hypothetical protein
MLACTLLVSCLPKAPAGAPPAIPGGDTLIPADSLGEDALLIALPSDDDTLAGKVRICGNAPGRSLEVSFQANPCLEHLRIQSFDAARHIRDTRRFTTDVNSQAVIQVVRIGASLSDVTDYQYEFNVTRKLVADDTVAYAECCARMRGACGGAFVRELYYGDGVYRLLRETSGRVEAGMVLVADGAVGASRAVLGEQSFRGFFAYKIKETPAPPPPPAEDRVVAIRTDGVADLALPSKLDGNALLEQQGARVLITTRSTAGTRGNQLRAVAEARQQQRRALKNLLAGPPYSTPPAQLNDRVERVYDGGEEVDAHRDDEGDWFVKMAYVIQ